MRQQGIDGELLREDDSRWNMFQEIESSLYHFQLYKTVFHKVWNMYK
jgi:hypothetical protein